MGACSRRLSANDIQVGQPIKYRGPDYGMSLDANQHPDVLDANANVAFILQHLLRRAGGCFMKWQDRLWWNDLAARIKHIEQRHFQIPRPDLPVSNVQVALH